MWRMPPSISEKFPNRKLEQGETVRVRSPGSGKWITLHKHDIGPEPEPHGIPRLSRWEIPRDLDPPPIATALGFAESVDVGMVQLRSAALRAARALRNLARVVNEMGAEIDDIWPPSPVIPFTDDSAALPSDEALASRIVGSIHRAHGISPLACSPSRVDAMLREAQRIAERPYHFTWGGLASGRGSNVQST